MAPSKVNRAWAIPLAVIGILAVTAPLVLAFLPAKWFIEKDRCAAVDADGNCTEKVTEAAEFALVPAAAQPVAPLLTVDGVETFPVTDDLYFVTVREPAITMLDWFATRDNPAARMRSHYDKYGDRTAEQRLQQGQAQMSGAKEWATYAALNRAGYEDAKFVPGNVMVNYVLCLQPNEDNTDCLDWPPSHDLLQDGDVITELDGVPVPTLDDLSKEMEGKKVGDTVTLTIDRNGTEVTGDVELIANPDEPDRPIIGFMPVDTSTLQLPEGFSVTFNTTSIGGPSAGLAFTLTLLDEITEGDLLGPEKIAVTGTINPDGTVGAIGGLNSKASAVMQVGAKYFLVPASQPETGPDSIEAARKVVGDNVEIIPVKNLDEALQVLVRLGGDPLPSAQELAASRR